MLFRRKENKYDAGQYGEQTIYYAHNGNIVGEFTIEHTYSFERQSYIRYIKNLCIYTEYRGQGYGNLMIAEMASMVKNTPYPLALDVWDDNYRAIHLYEKYGFVKTGTSGYIGAYYMILTN